VYSVGDYIYYKNEIFKVIRFLLSNGQEYAFVKPVNKDSEYYCGYLSIDTLKEIYNA